METISLIGLNRADVLAILYNRARPLGMGFLQYDPKPMTREEARGYLEKAAYFDYLKGRVMKVDLSGDALDPWGYDRDNGEGAAAAALAALAAEGETNPVGTQEQHRSAVLDSAEDVRSRLTEKTTLRDEGGLRMLTLGLADVADKLGPAVDKARQEKLESE